VTIISRDQKHQQYVYMYIYIYIYAYNAFNLFHENPKNNFKDDNWLSRVMKGQAMNTIKTHAHKSHFILQNNLYKRHELMYGTSLVRYL